MKQIRNMYLGMIFHCVMNLIGSMMLLAEILEA